MAQRQRLGGELTQEEWSELRSLDRAGIIDRIVQAAEGRIETLPPDQQGRFLFGRDKAGHATCLGWGEQDEHLDREQIRGCVEEIAAAGLCAPFLLFGVTTPFGDSSNRIFVQIPWCFDSRPRTLVRLLNGLNLRGKPVPYQRPTRP